VDSMGGRGEGRAIGAHLPSFLSFSHTFVKGGSYLEFCAQRTDEGEGFYLW
jgi:hypothetical protein